MAGGRRPIQGRGQRPRAQVQQGFSDFRARPNGQLTARNATGGRSWLGQAETAEGSLIPMGEGRNGYQQFGRVNIGNYTNQNPQSQGTPFAIPGMDRAGFADDFGWDPMGKANTQAWKGMLGTGAYESYGKPTGVFADVGIEKYGQTPFQGLAQRSQAQVQRPMNPRQQGRPQNSPGGMPNQGPQLRPSHPGDARFQGGASPTGGAPHNQIGQQGKGAGRRRPGGGKNQGGLPNTGPGGQFGGPPGVGGQFTGMAPGGMPDFNQGPPENFLPNTPGWELSRASASGNLLGAETGYNAANAMIPSQLALQQARLNTDRDLARRSLDENLAGRGLITSGLRAKAQNEQVATPYGRQYQDLGLGAASQYADASSQWGAANMGYNQDIINALMQRANDAYAAQPLGMSVGQYQAPDMPGYQSYYPPSAYGQGGRNGGGRRRPNRRGRGGKK